MPSKNHLRSKFLELRKKQYFFTNNEFFNPLFKLLRKKKINNKKLKLGIYYPCNFEINILQIYENVNFKRIQTSLPVIKKNYQMEFYAWKPNDILSVNEYGIPEPDFKKNQFSPNVILLPLLAFDKKKNRLGYGKGFYDRYLNKCLKKNKKILTIGIAFSFQKYKKIPTNKMDIKLDYILTERGLF